MGEIIVLLNVCGVLFNFGHLWILKTDPQSYFPPLPPIIYWSVNLFLVLDTS